MVFSMMIKDYPPGIFYKLLICLFMEIKYIINTCSKSGSILAYIKYYTGFAVIQRIIPFYIEYLNYQKENYIIYHGSRQVKTLDC